LFLAGATPYRDKSPGGQVSVTEPIRLGLVFTKHHGFFKRRSEDSAQSRNYYGK
jgi:hypothetical protein